MMSVFFYDVKSCK